MGQMINIFSNQETLNTFTVIYKKSWIYSKLFKKKRQTRKP